MSAKLLYFHRNPNIVILMDYSALMIQNGLKPLGEDLGEMDDVLRDLVNRKSITIMGIVRYAVLDKNKLQTLQAKFSRIITRFGHMLSLLAMKADDVHVRNGVASQEKLDTILSGQAQEVSLRQTKAEERKKDRQNVEKVLKLLEERPTRLESSGPKQTQAQILDQLEAELKKLGLSKEKAKTVRFKASQELQEQPRSSLLRHPVPAPWLKTLIQPAVSPMSVIGYCAWIALMVVSHTLTRTENLL